MISATFAPNHQAWLHFRYLVNVPKCWSNFEASQSRNNNLTKKITIF